VILLTSVAPRSPGEMHTIAPARALLCISADDVQLAAGQP
jgi:hypothetical protein